MIAGIQPQLSEAGKIKIGRKGAAITSAKGNRFRPPEKLDHFLITKNERDNDNDEYVLNDEVMSELTSRNGKIQEIPIVLHSDKIDEVFPTSYAMYTGKKVACRGDGNKACQWETVKGVRTGKRKEKECPCAYLNAEGNVKCKPHGTLHCSIAIRGHAVAGAVYKWRTTSIISIQRMIGSLQQILAVCGTLRGIPLWLKLEPVEVSPKGTFTSTVYCCHVELRATDLLDVQRRALELAQMRAVLGNPDMGVKALISSPASDNESEEESADVQEEFHPEYPDIILPDTGEVISGDRERVNVSMDDSWGFDDFDYEDSSPDEIAENAPENF